MRKHLLNTVLFLQNFAAYCPASASISDKAYSREEANEPNHTKPRIYIMNTGTESISDMYYYYYFEIENDKTPEYQVYWAPDQIINIEYVGGSLYRIKYTLTGNIVAPGDVFVAPDGNVIGIHYSDWSPWDKTNDFSCNGSNTFLENPNIAVYVNGTKVYGNEPIDSIPSVYGAVYREVWNGVSGIFTDSIPVNKAPTWTGTQTSLESPRNQGDNYGARICGYITAPENGYYTFWISSDDFSEFWISTDSLPSKKIKAAWVYGYCDFHQWNKYTPQKSNQIYFEKDSRYYIEILHKEGGQDDHCSVGWIKPGESGSVPSEIVPSSVLTPHFPKILPAAPTGLTATADSPFRINLSWTDQSWNESGFLLEVKEDGGRFTEFDSIASNQTSYQVNGLSPDTWYYFRIRAYNSYGKSDYSDSACLTTGSALSGTATHELWTNVPGIEISDIPFSTYPDIIDHMTTLETSQQWGNNYGRRIRGYITAPSSGTYYFWISSDDYSQLWLSPDTNPSSKVMIASVSGYTNFREWNKYPSQKSSAISLTGGKKYYFEILHKEGEQNDNMSVGWLKPWENGSQPSEIIPSWVLSPYIIPAVVLAPNGDSDNDGVSDGIEVYGPVKTDPKDSASFIDYVIPSRTILDYSVDNNITLDFARFYPDYSNSSAIPFNIKAGTFIGNLAPLFQMRNIPKGLSEIPRIPGYSPIGQAMNFEYFPIVSGEEVEVPIPFTNTQITSGTECFMVIRKNDSCDIVQPTSVNPGYLTVSVDSTVKSVILMQKGMSHGSAVAYLDGGMIYSHDNWTSISTNIVLRDCQPEHVNGALMKVFYTDISDPFNHVNDSVLFPLDTLRVNEGYLLKTRDIVRFAGAVKVNKMTLDIPNYYISYTDSTTHNVSRGQSLVFNCDRDIGYFSAIKNPVSASYGINYALESVSIDGEGRILQHRSGDSVTYSYEYYMKDHLGSTRMVKNDQNSITEKVAYQSYGTINPLDSSSPALPSREKFTGKEYDNEGSVNGGTGIAAYYFGARYYDPEIGIWFSTDPVDRMWTPYSYCGNNPVIMIDPNGEDFGISALIIIGIGAIVGAYTTTSAVEGTYDPTSWQWNGTTAGALVGGAILGGVAAGVGAAVTTGDTGAVGIATSSGLGGAIAGGAAGGAVGGAIGYTGSYAMQVGLTDKTWNTGEYFGGLGTSMLIGGVGGAIGGAISYGLNPNAVNQDIIKWGYEHGKYQGTLDFVSSEYNIGGKFTYQEFPGDARIPLTARGYTPSSSESYIYNEAFRMNGNFDASSVIQTMSHEGFHQSTFVANTTGSRIFSHVNEFYAYQHNLLSATQHGLSSAVRDYTYRQFMLNALRTPIQYMFLR